MRRVEKIPAGVSLASCQDPPQQIFSRDVKAAQRMATGLGADKNAVVIRAPEWHGRSDRSPSSVSGVASRRSCPGAGLFGPGQGLPLWGSGYFTPCRRPSFFDKGVGLI